MIYSRKDVFNIFKDHWDEDIYDITIRISNLEVIEKVSESIRIEAMRNVLPLDKTDSESVANFLKTYARECLELYLIQMSKFHTNYPEEEVRRECPTFSNNDLETVVKSVFKIEGYE